MREKISPWQAIVPGISRTQQNKLYTVRWKGSSRLSIQSNFGQKLFAPGPFTELQGRCLQYIPERIFSGVESYAHRKWVCAGHCVSIGDVQRSAQPMQPNGDFCLRIGQSDRKSLWKIGVTENNSRDCFPTRPHYRHPEVSAPFNHDLFASLWFAYSVAQTSRMPQARRRHLLRRRKSYGCASRKSECRSGSRMGIFGLSMRPSIHSLCDYRYTRRNFE